MSGHEAILQQILDEIDAAVEKFNGSLPAIQQKSYERIIELSKDLSIKNGQIDNTAANYRIISKIKGQIDNIILSPEYVKNVTTFANTFVKVASLQNKYFKALDSSYSPGELNNQFQKDAISNVVEHLTEQGIGANISGKVEEILKQSVTQGAKYTDMVKTMSDVMTNTVASPGLLVNYAKQIVTDSLHQFSRNYNQISTQDLGWEWFMYVGSLLTTSRPFCVAMVKKKYFHISELSDILHGDIDAVHVHINPKTDLPDGMIEGTNISNFPTLAGGWGCPHGVYSVPASIVPKSIRDGII